MDLGFLRSVAKPTRYTGGEVNQAVKAEREGLLHVALAFPDVYEIAMSTLGLKILYGVLNEREDVWAERVFMPMPDMQEALEARGLPLYGLESGRPLKAFDLVGFTLQFELTYTNILHMLRLGGVPLRAADRGPEDPVVVAGGPCAVNPEPLAPFFDGFFVGDGEEGILDLCEAVRATRGRPRRDVWRALASVEGTYVPALYRTERDPATGMEVVTGPAEEGAPFPVRRRLLRDIDAFPFPSKVIVPHHEVVHDRYSLELSRGCAVGCRFCQAGYIYRPQRDRDAGAVRAAVARGLESTGFNEVTLLSLNAGEYAGIERLARAIAAEAADRGVGVAMPSLRVSSLTRELVGALSAGRKSGFTIAPEAGTERLRAVINKKISEEDLVNAVTVVFSSGWSVLKLYFMIGLPTERPEDVDAIARLADLSARAAKNAGCRNPVVTISTSSFVPKPFTPFQWFPMEGPDSLRDKQARLKSLLRRPAQYRWHDVEGSLLEGAFSLGDRRLADVLEEASGLGCRLDSWTEHFRPDLWREAFSRKGLTPEEYLHRERGREERFPWEVVDVGVTRSFLWRERERALAGETTETCGPEACHGCAPFAKDCLASVFARALPKEAASVPRPPVPAPARHRLRFRKEGPSVFLGHLDLTEALVRALRRAGAALAYSQGYHPMPKIELCAPLPLGVEGREEWMDFTAHVGDRGLFLGRLAATLPSGILAERLFPVPEGSPSLSELALQVYEVGLGRLDEAERAEVRRRAEAFRASESWPVTREGKGKTRTFDLRARVQGLEVEEGRIEVRLLQGGFMDLVEAVAPEPLRDRLSLVRLGLRFAPRPAPPPAQPASKGRAER
ncbi:MAG: TIGR03960 family B12-binding radical SAM protein [Acidobacteriota bacterium]